ncbi:pyridoxal phosphate-dependent aminotransferase [Mangrovibacterium lignilyticum]|uniref:pyridoxal phosphate-dependent aminotransferase n=1 Tax=Mangrovibacterium lignilyticum TaxID=2668052 RepID=UPI0019677382|nr:pyridoxal phosphate-dependent aminotransferase [Mangrovibacterium lignilyticum]
MTASRVKEINPFIVMEVLEKAHAMEKEGKSIIHLEVGEPDFDIPVCVKEAVCNALNGGRTHYTHSLGDPELRQAIADQYQQEYGVTVDPDQIIVTSGSSPAILMALSVLCETGDEVIISDPAYACYDNFIHYIGAKIVRVPVSPLDGFQFHAEDIIAKINERTRAIIINSPMNPTGNLLTDESLQMMASLNVPIISDEIYHGLVYGQKARSILEFTDQAFVLNGFSKRYAMTGLRLGYLIAPKPYIRTLQKIQQNLFICASSTAQRGGIAALKQGAKAVSEMVEVYDERRKFMIQRLRQLGFNIPVEPTGAFYIFVDASHLSSDSYHLAFDILEKAHVGVTPGIDFGPGGEGYLRFSYANSLENITEGLNRLEKYLQSSLQTTNS